MSFPLNPIDGTQVIQNGIEYTYSAITNSWRRNYNNVLDKLFIGGLYPSTTSTNGALIVLGGVGIGGNLNVGQNTTVNGIFNANGSVNLNPASGNISIQPTLGGSVVINPNAVGSINNMTIGSISPQYGKFTDISVLDTTNASSPITGALTVAGGAGIAKDLYVGGKIYASAFATISNSSTWYYTNTNYSASNGDKLFLDTSVNTLTVTLPLIPTIGDSVQFLDYLGTFNSNNMTFNGNGQKIMDLNEPLIVDVAHAANFLVYAGTATGWLIGAVF